VLEFNHCKISRLLLEIEMNTASNPFDDMSNDLDFGAPSNSTTSEVTYFEQACTKCNGTGRYTFGYIHVRSGECFACKGKGKLSFKTSPATRLKAKMASQKRAVAVAEAKATTAQEWKDANPAEALWMETSATKFAFAGAMLDALNKFGSLTEKQFETVQRLTLQSAQFMAERAAEKTARIASAPVVTVEAIEVAFNNAKQAGVKRPKLRLDTFVFSPAAETSANVGAIYIKNKEDGLYLGKVMGGRLFASRDCTTEASERIVAVASDPAQAAIAYGKKFGACSVCGRALTDADSIARGIGPVCAENYGF
jgi:hypothetical protein